MKSTGRSIAYFSMEIGLRSEFPTYCGGLGVLAGDTVRAAADLGMPLVAITLLHRGGYFRQELAADGTQIEHPEEWDIRALASEERDAQAVVEIEGRRVAVRAWRHDVEGIDGASVPVYLLDSDIEGNDARDRALSGTLYTGDHRYRIGQEIILGIGGARLLEALGYRDIRRYHLNEGHSALLTFELLAAEAAKHGRTRIDDTDVESVRRRCVFTTHTPVPAGHDRFDLRLAREVIGHHPVFERSDLICCDGELNMTHLALNLGGYINGVAQRHGEVSRRMFAGYEIDAITNGVHVATWTSEPFAELFDRHLPGWRRDNYALRYARSTPADEVAAAHARAKRALVVRVREAMKVELDPEVFTIGFARRATAYKRTMLFFHDPARLRSIAERFGPMQIIFAGKAHPGDEEGKEAIRRVHRSLGEFGEQIRGVYLPDYNMDLARLVVSGVDIWLNTPRPPQEASGTSGMKAALNGVPSLSILDGWWIEGCIDGVSGWSIGRAHDDFDDKHDTSGDDAADSDDAASLYDRLERDVLPLFHHDRTRFIDIMRSAIALNGSFFNAQRMLEQYAAKAYR